MARHLSKWLRGQLPVTSRISAPALYCDQPIEEQTLPKYVPQLYYPVVLGEVFHDRYEIIAKLGFGGSSTVWLAHDLQRWKWQNRNYLVIKALTNNVKADAPDSELEISKRISTADPTHEGLRYLRTIEKSFEVLGPDGRHIFLLYQPMRETLTTFKRRLRDHRIPGDFLKLILKVILTGLDYLHTRCHLIHTDLKPDNILMGCESPSIIDDLVQDEISNPSPQLQDKDRFIYPTRNFGDLQGTPGKPKIADFGLAVRGDVLTPHNHPIQADLFQAPEVILRAGWTYSADIWNFGVMIWDLLENETLFDATDPETGIYSEELHLQEMISMLGPPPATLVKRGKLSTQYLTIQDNPMHSGNTLPSTSGFEDRTPSLFGDDKLLFITFIRKMLCWLPEQRATAKELMQDPWLNS